MNVTTTVEEISASTSLVPAPVANLWDSLVIGTRIIKRTAEGMERTVIGIDEITTLMLSQQREKLLKELAPA